MPKFLIDVQGFTIVSPIRIVVVGGMRAIFCLDPIKMQCVIFCV